MSGTTTRARFWGATAAYLGACLLLVGLGWTTGLKPIEMVGFLLLAGTVVPLPFDLYVLHLVPRMDLVLLVLAAGTLNTVAVAAERWFLLRLLAAGRGRLVRDTVRSARLSRWFRRAPTLVVFVCGFTILPFEPVRFLAVVNDHRVDRYLTATFLGRTLRFAGLVWLGDQLLRFSWFNTVLLVLFVAYLVSLFDARRLKGLFGQSEDDRDLPAEPAPEPMSA